MNIFYVETCPTESARALCDKHVVKMPLESAQMLCAPYLKAPYRRVHYNHPCTVWARQSKANYEWLLDHAFSLLQEYTNRYSRIHASGRVVKWCQDNYNKLNFPEDKLTLHPQCFGDWQNDCFTPNDPREGYRKYYWLAKRSLAKWKNSETPAWHSLEYYKNSNL